jgi:hypothetical protein
MIPLRPVFGDLVLEDRERVEDRVCAAAAGERRVPVGEVRVVAERAAGHELLLDRERLVAPNARRRDRERLDADEGDVLERLPEDLEVVRRVQDRVADEPELERPAVEEQERPLREEVPLDVVGKGSSAPAPACRRPGRRPSTVDVERRLDVELRSRDATKSSSSCRTAGTAPRMTSETSRSSDPVGQQDRRTASGSMRCRFRIPFAAARICESSVADAPRPSVRP